jgi:hypothetical protein
MPYPSDDDVFGKVYSAGSVARMLRFPYNRPDFRALQSG